MTFQGCSVISKTWIGSSKGIYMDKQQELLEEMRAINLKLQAINQHLLRMFWVVAIFALLYFGLLLYLFPFGKA